jgi:hypothetical protein
MDLRGAFKSWTWVQFASHDDLWLEGGMQVKTVPVTALDLRHGICISVRVEFWDPLSQKEIDQILKGVKPGADWEKEKTLRQWREWGTGLEGFVRLSAAGCVFIPGGIPEVLPLPQTPVPQAPVPHP